jgi:hypothetical protein
MTEFDDVTTRDDAPDEAAPPLEMEGLRSALEGTHSRLTAIEAALEATTRQVGYLPPQVRGLSAKIDSLATSVADVRLRGLLLGVIGLHDLASAEGRRTPDGAPPVSGPPAAGPQLAGVLATQIRQLLTLNGVEPIEGGGRFDPTLHRAIERVDVTDPELDGRVLTVFRLGFRTEHAVLRYAEVAVGCYAPREIGQEPDGPASQSSLDGPMMPTTSQEQENRS